MPRRGSPYGPSYERRRKQVLAGGARCHVCGDPATEADHVPPLVLHRHVNGSGCCELLPSCGSCAREQGGQLVPGGIGRRDPDGGDIAELPEPLGYERDAGAWAVEWLDDLLDVPDDAAWPRLMTLPHPRAVASLGLDFEAWVKARNGRTLRWFQRLAVRRMLEVDVEGRLVWDTVLLTLARQVGKSWLLRELLMWRMHQGEHFGEAQQVVLISMQKGQARDVFDPELRWCKARPDLYGCREVNAEEEVNLLDDGSRWLLTTKGTSRTGGAYGRSTALGVVDEGWSVRAFTVDEALEPSLVEVDQSQLVLVSTAHRMATSLMLDRRSAALAALDDPDAGDLIVEWSAPPDVDINDRAAWRQASPHWSPRRERAIAKAVQRALAGFASNDNNEPDPIEAVRAQWLNIWPTRLALTSGEELLDLDRWRELLAPSGEHRGRLWVAIEDNYGDGAAVAAVAELEGERYEVDGWTCDTRTEATATARQLVDEWPGTSTLLVAPSVRDRTARAIATATETRYGLSLLRSLVKQGRLSHDDTPDLDAQLVEARVRPMPGGGLSLAPGTRTDLVRAVVWALRAAEVSVPLPAIA
jgi:hypothetical protein